MRGLASRGELAAFGFVGAEPAHRAVPPSGALMYASWLNAGTLAWRDLSETMVVFLT